MIDREVEELIEKHKGKVKPGDLCMRHQGGQLKKIDCWYCQQEKIKEGK